MEPAFEWLMQESIYFFGHRLAEADVILAAIAIN